MIRIAVIEDGYVRDAQIFTADPAIMETDPDWENNFHDLKYPCQYVGIFVGIDENDIRKQAADHEGVHPDVITLITFGQVEINPVVSEADSCRFAFESLRDHVGHQTEVVIYGGDRNVAVECVDCQTVLYSEDNPAYETEVGGTVNG